MSASEVIKLNRDKWIGKVTYIAQIPSHQAPLQAPGDSLIIKGVPQACADLGETYVCRGQQVPCFQSPPSLQPTHIGVSSLEAQHHSVEDLLLAIQDSLGLQGVMLALFVHHQGPLQEEALRDQEVPGVPGVEKRQAADIKTAGKIGDSCVLQSHVSCPKLTESDPGGHTAALSTKICPSKFGMEPGRWLSG